MRNIRFKDLFLKIRNLSKKTLGITMILLIISIIFSFITMTKPQQTQEKIQSNKIIEKTNITYSTDSLPDGITSINGTIFSKIQKNLKVNINSTINSQEEVAVQGEVQVNSILIAEGMWQQIIPLGNPLKIDLNGKENVLINGEFNLNLGDINNRIEKAEEQIGTSPSKYIIKIKPEIKANATYKTNQIQVDNTPELSFEYSYGQIKLIGENKEFLKETPLEEVKMVNSELNLFGVSMPLIVSRCIFVGISLALLFIIIANKKALKVNLHKNVLSSKDIDKRYKSRIIILQQDPELKNKIILSVSNFKELINIANDKELSVLRYCKEDKAIIFYYVIDNDCVFTYSAAFSEEMTKININNASLGSDVSNG